ncbi:MAG: hypothetical protein AB7I41_13910 [Candidatus Sericytochromatia bacterium]
MKALIEPDQLLAKALYPLLESDLIRLMPGISVDHIASIRDQAWFQGQSNSSLLQILRNHAHKYLRNAGHLAYPDPTGEDNVQGASDVWRWLTFALPPDLILAAGWSLNGPQEISWETPLLGNHLREHGIAQTHVHLGAAGEFSSHWCQVQDALRDPRKAETLADKGAPFDGGIHFLSWLTAAGLARLLMCEYVCESQQPNGLIHSFQQTLENISENISHDESLIFFEAIHALRAPQHLELPEYQRLQNLYSRLTEFNLPIQKPHDIWLLDPIVRSNVGTVSGDKHEIYWLRKAFDYIETPTGREDDFFQKLLWQIIRIKVMYYRYIVQRPMVKGLSWFIHFYKRIGKLMHSRFALEQAFFLEGGRNHTLKSYEFRTAPIEKFTKFRNQLRSTLNEWLEIEEKGNVEIGCVLHIPKNRGPATKTKQTAKHWMDSWLNPENNTKEYRLSTYFNTKKKQINTFCRILTEVPLSLAFIRGFDMCTDEVGIPNWFMSYLLFPLKEAGNIAFQQANYKYPEWPLKPFRRTMHVGEDFSHLLDGIRRMDEVITRFPLERGDRIGHGLALGLSPKRWVEQHPIVWMPKEIRLWDLIWEWKQYRLGHAKISNSRLEKIKALVSQYASEILGPECQTQDACQLYEQLFDPDKLERVGFPNGEKVMDGLEQLTSQNRDFYWLYTYLTDSQCFHQCYQVVEIHNTSDEQEALYAMQRVVRQRVCQKEITIEVNPSSNFLIADLQNLEHHPLWNLNPPPGHPLEEEMGPAVNICIGSDDPITFATNLPQEYELLYNVLLQKGIGSTAALQWLEQVRQTGLNARFTLSFGPQNRDADQVWRQLLRDLKADWQPQDARL